MIARTGALASAILGIGALVGCATGQPFLLGIHSRYNPRAPNTAIGLVLLGAGLYAMPGPRGGDSRSSLVPWVPGLAGAGAAVTVAISLLRLFEYVSGRR